MTKDKSGSPVSLAIIGRVRMPHPPCRFLTKERDPETIHCRRRGFTKALAKDLTDSGVLVNAIAGFGFDSDLLGLRAAVSAVNEMQS
jgi:hypothetical protein